MNEKLSRFKAEKCLQFFVCKMGLAIITMYLLCYKRTGEHIQYFVKVASKHTESNKLYSKPSFINFMF